MDIKSPIFRGTSFHSMDSKGRFAVPARFKEPIRLAGGKLFISRFEGALHVYSPAKWAEIERNFQNIGEIPVDRLWLTRFFIGGAVECVCDNQNRMLVPQELRQYAKLKKDIVLIGIIDFFQIWSRKNLERDNRKWGDGKIIKDAKELEEQKVRNIIYKLVT